MSLGIQSAVIQARSEKAARWFPICDWHEVENGNLPKGSRFVAKLSL